MTLKREEIMQGTVPDARRRGTPRTAWMDNIKTWTGLPVEESVRMIEDRYNIEKVSAGSRLVLLMLQHYAHSRNRPTATDEKKKNPLYFSCDFSVWYNLGTIIKIVATRCHILKLKLTKFDFGCGSAPDTAGELTPLPQSL